MKTVTTATPLLILLPLCVLEVLCFSFLVYITIRYIVLVLESSVGCRDLAVSVLKFYIPDLSL